MSSPPIKSSGAKSSMGFPGQKYCTHIATFSLLGEVCDLCEPLFEGESMRIPANRFLQTLLYDSNMYLYSIALVNFSHSYMVSSLSAS